MVIELNNYEHHFIFLKKRITGYFGIPNATSSNETPEQTKMSLRQKLERSSNKRYESTSLNQINTETSNSKTQLQTEILNQILFRTRTQEEKPVLRFLPRFFFQKMNYKKV